MGAVFMVPSEQILERQTLARVIFAPELGFNRFRLGFPNLKFGFGNNWLLVPRKYRYQLPNARGSWRGGHPQIR